MDRALALVFAAWAVLTILPVGAWTGVGPFGAYADAWSLWIRMLGLVALLTVLVVMLAGARAAAGLRRAAAAVLRVPLPVFLGLVGATAMLEAVVVAVWCFGRMPPLIDAWVQYFQARILLSGAWVAPPAPSPAHFAILFAPITEGGWFGQYPPVHPALLAIGMALGSPWLVTPVLAAALPAAVYALGAAGGDPRVGRLAALLVLASPFVIAIDASAMNHLPAALLVSLGLATLGRVAAGRGRAGLVLGAAVGLLLGLRPLDGGILAAAGALAVLAGLRTRGGVMTAAAVALAGLVTLAPTLLYNRATTGGLFTFTYARVQGTLLGLEQDVPWGTTLTALRALGLTALDGHRMNVALMEWPIPVTALAALGLWAARRGPAAAMRGSAVYVLGLVGALFFYFHRDVLFGPRLLFSAVPPLLVLAAAGVVALADLRRPLGPSRLALGDVAALALGVTAALAASTLVPSRLAAHRTVGSPVALHPEEDARRAGLARALVLIPDGLGSRLIVRMWAAGVPMTATAGLYKRADACRLGDTIATLSPGLDFRTRLEAALADATPGRRVRGATPDPMLRLPDDGRPSERCAGELARDRRGTLQFAPYLYLNDPALDGPIVWARDLTDEENATLARRYPDRPMYRYRGPRKDGTSPFELVAEPAAATVAASNRS